jgi:hypothetical protein
MKAEMRRNMVDSPNSDLFKLSATPYHKPRATSPEQLGTTDKSNKLKWVMPCAGVQSETALFHSHLHTCFALRAPVGPIFEVFIEDLIEVRSKYAGAN